jgi:hypothetical protein
MYVCHFCKQTTSPNIPTTRITIETRARSYPARANLVSRGRRKDFANDPGGQGREIVREAIACPSCAAAFAASKAQN